MATAKELNELSVEELGRRATELREALFQDKLKLRTGTLDSPSERAKKKKELARVLGAVTRKSKAAR
jgi:large subunit ribosomal protein L29